MKKVCVVGLGYIGLPTAVLAAQSGFEVVGIDVNEDRVAGVNAGKAVIEEHELVLRLTKVLQAKTFRATTIYEQADYFIIAVPTPFTDDKKADLSYVFAAASALAGVLKKGDTVILESTVPVGTTVILGQFLAKKTGLTVGIDLFVSHCPERVLPGNIFHELQVNDRVIGGVDRSSTRQSALFYKQFVSGDLYLTSAQAAEMAKLIENSYRDVNVAFAHQVASMAYAVNLDPYEVIELANKHPRVNILRPTCGVGGHCLAVDPWFLVETFPAQSGLLKEARLVNDRKPFEVVDRIDQKIAAWKQSFNKKNCNVLVLGATYKPNVDDLRESPAVTIINELLKKRDYTVKVCEPHATAVRLQEVTTACTIDFKEGIAFADVIVCLVAHNEFKPIEKAVVAHKKVLDFCGLLHVVRTPSIEQEQFFWTDNKQNDLFVAGLVGQAQETLT